MSGWVTLVEDALPAFGLAGFAVSLLQDFKNVSCKLSKGEQRYFAKLHHGPHAQAARVQAEQQWLAFLDQRVPCPRPLRTRDDAYLLELIDPATGKTGVLTVSAWLDGHCLDQDDRRPEHFHALGRELAQVHEAARSFVPPAGFNREVAGSTAIADLITDTSRLVVDAQATAADRALIVLLFDRLRDLEQQAEAAGLQPHLVHHDPSFGNVLFDGPSPRIIDYDDMRIGHGYLDLGVVLAGPLGRADFLARKDALLAGYAELSPPLPGFLTDAWPIYTAYRTLTMIWGCACSPEGSPQRSWLPGQIERLRCLQEYL